MKKYLSYLILSSVLFTLGCSSGPTNSETFEKFPGSIYTLDSQGQFSKTLVAGSIADSVLSESEQEQLAKVISKAKTPSEVDEVAFSFFCHDRKPTRGLKANLILSIPKFGTNIPLDEAAKQREGFLRLAREAAKKFFLSASANPMPLAEHAVDEFYVLKNNQSGPKDYYGKPLYRELRFSDLTFFAVVEDDPKKINQNSKYEIKFGADNEGLFILGANREIYYNFVRLNGRGPIHLVLNTAIPYFVPYYRGPSAISFSKELPLVKKWGAGEGGILNILELSEDQKKRFENVPIQTLSGLVFETVRPITFSWLFETNLLGSHFVLMMSDEDQKRLFNISYPQSGGYFYGYNKSEMEPSAVLRDSGLMWGDYIESFTTVQEAIVSPSEIKFDVSLDLAPFCQFGRPRSQLITK